MASADRPLDGLTVLITGAGRGIGRGVALAAADAGAHVVVTSLLDTEVTTQEEIADRGGAATWVRCDVRDASAVAHAVSEAIRVTGRLDGLIHNALSPPEWDDPRAASISELPLELWEHHASVALRGAYRCARTAFPWLEKTRGRLILLSAAAGIEGTPVQPAYAACKGGIRALTRSLAREFGPAGVTVNAVSPFVSTPAFDKWWDEEPGARAATEALTAQGRLGEPEADVAPVFVFLLSPASHYMTGQTIFADAGRYITA